MFHVVAVHKTYIWTAGNRNTGNRNTEENIRGSLKNVLIELNRTTWMDEVTFSNRVLGFTVVGGGSQNR